MRCYLVQVSGAKRYAATQAAARETRLELMELAQVKKDKVSITEVEVPMAKAELLAFINNLCIGLDNVQ